MLAGASASMSRLWSLLGYSLASQKAATSSGRRSTMACCRTDGRGETIGLEIRGSFICLAVDRSLQLLCFLSIPALLFFFFFFCSFD